VIFLRHWWVRRKRLNEEWAQGMRQGISKTEFRRLQFTVLSVIFFYFPFALWEFAEICKYHLIPFSWSRIHGPDWAFISLVPNPKATLGVWLGPVAAFTSFIFVGTTRNARQTYVFILVRTYELLPRKFRSRFTWMERNVNAIKEKKAAKKVLTNGALPLETKGTMVERYLVLLIYLINRKSVKVSKTSRKNWFDHDEDFDDHDVKSIPSSDATLVRDDESLNSRLHLEQFSPPQGTAEVSAGTGTVPNWNQGITVTRQVIVETSSR
jgi:hypothetical protein